MKDVRKQIGTLGEEVAAQLLEEKGYQILTRNWRSQLGELDLIVTNQRDLVFVEVRTTTSTRFGYGFQSVDGKKQQQVRKIALQYVLDHVKRPYSLRFDVVSVLLNRQTGQAIETEHFEGAF
ncbi:putative endonuclease [Croceifilum oryzae]|uniref:UPF0102 protein J2Z48_001515 n=1 Tax=Croceifilum oryzae TaxID=1553429 RepID=A0AAJ1WQA4_9BACL|nr:YraN family protein [Croceifilum oryzae]MDQ0417342.1 putative endonuclease [Croceifilum oryzae]